jgi:glyoxylase-like metal-dependent hydrolase (beta-lactamase superfamily II)
MRLYFLRSGLLDLEMRVLMPEYGKGSRLHVPIPVLLIQADGRNILFDTGLPDFCIGNPRAEEGEGDPPEMVPIMTEHETIVAQLATLGIKPANLDTVVNSHLHFDHCGGNKHFTACPILVHEKELAAARVSDAYLPVFEGPGVQFKPITGDYELAQGVQLLETPGHSPGHFSLLVRLPQSGAMLMTIDAVYTGALWQQDALGTNSNGQDARRSMNRLRQIAQEAGAQVIFGHDLAQWAALRHAPDYYE